MSSSPPRPSSPYLNSDTDDYSDSDYDENPTPHLLWSIIRCGLSVESEKLQILSGDGDRYIYGDIHVNGGSYGKAYSIYHRKSDNPQVFSSASGGDLTISGPRYFLTLSGERPDILYVNLHEGGVPFLQQRFPLDLSSLETNQTIPVSVIGEKCILTFYMTWVSPSILARLYVDLVNVISSDRWLLSGTISVIQTLSGGHTKRVLSMLHSDSLPLSDVPIILLGSPFSTPARAFPLDRNVVLAPVHLEDDVVKMANNLILGSGSCSPFVDPSHLNGIETSLSIDLDLKFVDDVDHNINCLIKDMITFNLKGSHKSGELYFEYVEGVVKSHKRKHASMVGSSERTTSDDKLKIKVMIHTFDDVLSDIPNEVFEDELPLYTCPLSPEDDKDSEYKGSDDD